MSITSYSAVHNADGGLAGEARYVLGHIFGRTECGLCDITHSPLRRKPEWDRMLERSAVPIHVLHRNEVAPALAVLLGGSVEALHSRWVKLLPLSSTGKIRERRLESQRMSARCNRAVRGGGTLHRQK